MNIIKPDWPAPAHIHAYTTTRQVWGENTTGASDATAEERTQLVSLLSLPAEPLWLKQTHSTIAVRAENAVDGVEADASYTSQTGQICLVLTADCLPVLICDKAGKNAAAIHAGWRGLAKGVMESTVHAMDAKPNDLMVWLGPAIGPNKFEVGPDVYQAFVEYDQDCTTCFTPHYQEKWMANLYQLAVRRLNKIGIHAIYGGEYCTHTQKDLFFSYRRDRSKTGRMASVIWIDDSMPYID
ncbi:MAG TPA: peptidoglycan editing factor PgeF [Gammaproteobacteria bacterium]|jgi:YfiH family protein|nr:peptidoglycan editing factor PgeF [Gammaproteobacteria bacterium]